METKRRLNALTEEISGAATAVRHEIGAGALESSHAGCMAFELADRGLAFEREKALPIASSTSFPNSSARSASSAVNVCQV
jgi:GxxExxY protein